MIRKIGRRSVGVNLIVVVIALQVTSLAIAVVIAAMFFVQQRTVGDNSTFALFQIAPYIERAADGTLFISADGLSEGVSRSESFWMFASDGTETLSFGTIPSDVRPFLGTASEIVDQLGVLDEYQTPAGKLTLFAGGSVPSSADFFNFIWHYSADLFPFIFLPYTLLALVFVPKLVRRSMSPILESARAADRLQPELQGQRLPTDAAPTEVLPLINAVNAALARIDEWGARQRRFIANAAHELRTPVTVLQVRLDALPPSDLAEALREDCRRIAQLANRLLEIERLRETRMDRRIVDLGVIARDAALQFAPLALHHGLDFSLEPAARPVLVDGNAEAIQQCLINLLENALRHGGKTVVLRVTGDPIARVSVRDSGAGVNSDLSDSLFEPFVGTPGRGGAGLGLALVTEIMAAHGGRACHATGTDGMTEFHLEFPAPAQD